MYWSDEDLNKIELYETDGMTSTRTVLFQGRFDKVIIHLVAAFKQSKSQNTFYVIVNIKCILSAESEPPMYACV